MRNPLGVEPGLGRPWDAAATAGAVLGHGARWGVACSGLGCGLRSKTTSAKGIGGCACAHRGLGLHWEAGQSRRRWSLAAWRRLAFEERSLRGPRNSWVPRIDARDSYEYATGVRGLRDRRQRGNRGGAGTFTFGWSGAIPATQRARTGARATGGLLELRQSFGGVCQGLTGSGSASPRRRNELCTAEQCGGGG